MSFHSFIRYQSNTPIPIPPPTPLSHTPLALVVGLGGTLGQSTQDPGFKIPGYSQFPVSRIAICVELPVAIELPGFWLQFRRKIRVINSRIRLSWSSKGRVCIPLIEYTVMLSSLLFRPMCDGSVVTMPDAVQQFSLGTAIWISSLVPGRNIGAEKGMRAYILKIHSGVG
jgi:hypothetical protein